MWVMLVFGEIIGLAINFYVLSYCHYIYILVYLQVNPYLLKIGPSHIQKINIYNLDNMKLNI